MTRAMIAAMGAVLVVAGVASASVFSSTSDSSTRVTAVQSHPRPTLPPPPVIAKTQAPIVVTKISTSTAPELQRPPVPLRQAPRPPVPIKEDIAGKSTDGKSADSKSADSKSADSKAIDGKSDKPVDTAAATAPTTEDAEGARLAKSAIERDGYKNVRVVAKSADGSWRGRARRGQTEVGVTVDAGGNVRVD